MILTKEIVYKQLADFFTGDAPFVLFGTGISCALDRRFGMQALEDHLKQQLDGTLLQNQQEQWERVVEALQNSTCDFETAMDHIDDEDLVHKIIDLTGDFVSCIDEEFSYPLLSGQSTWPASKLFKSLVSGLPEQGGVLHVATPNYDLLAEYFFIQSKIKYITGFYGGIYKIFDLKRAQRQVLKLEKSSNRSRISTVCKEEKHVRLYKPHGSLNTFSCDNGIIECDLWTRRKPANILRYIITPGSKKYQRLHENRIILNEYDNALKSQRKFLFLGFGFNDSQLINNTLRNKLDANECSAVIITRDINERIINWLQHSKKMLVICMGESDNSTRILSSTDMCGITLANCELWKFDIFAKEVFGR